MTVGVDPDELPMNASLPTAQPFVFRRLDFKEATKGNSRVTLITTACYSGGWAVDPELNVTTMTAAGKGQVSESWYSSNSLGRSCGSIYTSSLLSTIRDECQNAQPEGETETAEQIGNQKTYEAFTDAVYDTLVNRIVDRFGTDHDIQFSAQDDDWESSWAPRTGLSLGDYARRWNQLKIYPPSDDPNSLRNRDPSIQVGGQLQKNRPSTAPEWICGRFGGGISQRRQRLRMLGLSYLSSFPGRSSLLLRVMRWKGIRDIYQNKK
jgi:hypothetical protein